MPSQPLDLERIFRRLNAVPDLRYVLIGGMAVAAHGGTRVTRDVDLAILFDAENRRRIVEALAPLNPQPRQHTPGAAWVWDQISVSPPWCVFETDAGRVDLIIRLPGVRSFGELYERSEVFNLGDMTVRVASIDDLISMKRAADRDVDRNDVDTLSAIRRLHAEQAEET